MKAIYQWVLRTMMKSKGETGVIRTMPKQKIIEMNAQITAQRLMQNGINPNDLKNANQVENIINKLDEPRVISADSTEGQGITEALLGKKNQVFDMEGNKIPEGSKIMGGKEVKPIDELQNYTKSKEEIVQNLVDRKFGKGYFDNVDGSEAAIKDAAIKARLDAGNKKGIETIKINLVDDSIAKIKSLKPMDAMKEANLVAGKKGRYANLDDNQVKKIIDDTNDHIFERDIPVDPEDMAQGGRAGFKAGLGKRFLELFKPKPKTIFDETKFREGPITSEFLEKIDKKDIEPFIRTRDTMGRGSYGMYDDFADMPAGLKAAELISRIKTKDGGINYSMAEMFIGKKLKGNESIDELIEMVVTEKKADGGRIGYKVGSVDKLSKAFKEFMKKFKIKQSGDDVKDFLSKRQFMKDIVGNTEKNKKARDLQMLKEAAEEARAEGGFKFKDVDVDKDIRPIFDQSKDRTLNATGGRIGYKVGSVDKMRRLILKAMGAGTVGIGAAKSGIFSGFGKGATKQVAKEVVQQSTTTPPPYFFKLAEKIKKMGDDVTEKAATKDREVVTKYKDYELTEDLTTGETTIKRIKMDTDAMYYDEMLAEDVYMNYKPGKGQADEVTPKVADEYTEDTSYLRTSGPQKGDIYDTVEGVPKDIIEEVGEAKSIKYASGGLAYMLGE